LSEAKPGDGHSTRKALPASLRSSRATLAGRHRLARLPDEMYLSIERHVSAYGKSSNDYLLRNAHS
jgi:hypothetical protein